MRILVVALVVLAAAHAGCTVYHHPSYTPQLWARDSYECERDARQSGYFGTGIWAGIEGQSFYDRCLAARGWTRSLR